MRKLLLYKKFVFTLIVIIFFILVFYIANSYESTNYNPKKIMVDYNTTVEGGRETYDSFNVQKYLFETRYPQELQKMVFLTFDDGPSLDNTPEVLKILKEHDVKATFFVLGINLDKGVEYENLLKQIILDGHAIANHGYSHNYEYLYPNRYISFENVMADMMKTEKKLKEILGEDFNTNVWRLPGGFRSWRNQQDNLYKFNEAGYSIIEWNALNGDSEGKNRSSEELYNIAINTSKNSNFVVMLMHDFAGEAGKSSYESLSGIIEHFKNNGYQFRTMY